MSDPRIITDLNNIYFHDNKLQVSSVKPTTGSHKVGDIAVAKTQGSIYGWICVQSGTPGVWKELTDPVNLELIGIMENLKTNNKNTIVDAVNELFDLFPSEIIIIPKYNITFEENGGSAVTDINQVTNIPSSLPISTKTNMLFKGWFTDSGLTIPVTLGQTLTTNITLYAKWEQLKYNITFEENGGSTVTDITGVTKIPNSLPTPTKTNMLFKGWFTDSGLTTAVTLGQVLTSNITLYAKWSDDIYSGEWIIDKDILFGVTWHTVEYFNGKIYIIGGIAGAYADDTMYDDIENDLQISTYDIATGEFNLDAIEIYDLLGGKTEHASAIVDGKLYIIGGQQGHYGSEYDGTVRVYDLINGEWNRYDGGYTIGGIQAVVVDKTIYIMGGYSTIPYRYAFGFNTTTNTWTYLEYINPERSGHAVAAHSTNIYIMSGYSYGEEAYSTSTSVYDTLTDTYSESKMSRVPASVYYGKAETIGDIIHLVASDCRHYLYDVLTNTWNTGAPMPSFRDNHAMCVAGNRLYAVGGDGDRTISGQGKAYSRAVEYYKRFVDDDGIPMYNITFEENGGTEVDNIIGVFNIPKSLPTPSKTDMIFRGWFTDYGLTEQVELGQMLTKDITLYAKWSDSNFDMVIGEWTEISDLDSNRLNHVSGGYKDNIFVLGGTRGTSILGSSILGIKKYNITSGNMTEVTGNTNLTSGMASGVLGSKIYLAGGLSATKTASCFDMELETLTAITSPTVSFTNPCGDIVGNLFCVFNPSTRTVYSYDISTTTWTSLGSYSQWSNNVTEGVAAAGKDGNLYIVGGQYTDSNDVVQMSNTLREFNVSSQTFTTKANITKAVSHGKFTTLGDYIYYTGGSAYTLSIASSLNRTYRYNPSSNEWSTDAAMKNKKEKHSVAVLQGALFATGGQNVVLEDYKPAIKKVEYYKPEEIIDIYLLTDKSSVGFYAGSSGTVGVKLNTDPTKDVVINVNASNVSVNKSSLTFNSSNWNSYQQITISSSSVTNGSITLSNSEYSISKNISVSVTEQPTYVSVSGGGNRAQGVIGTTGSGSFSLTASTNRSGVSTLSYSVSCDSYVSCSPSSGTISNGGTVNLTYTYDFRNGGNVGTSYAIKVTFSDGKNTESGYQYVLCWDVE